MNIKRDSTGREKEPTHFKLGYGQSTALAFLSGKGHIQHGEQRKTRPGEKELHTEALVENAAFVPKVAAPTPDIPVINPEKLPVI